MDRISEKELDTIIDVANAATVGNWRFEFCYGNTPHSEKPMPLAKKLMREIPNFAVEVMGEAVCACIVDDRKRRICTVWEYEPDGCTDDGRNAEFIATAKKYLLAMAEEIKRLREMVNERAPS